MSRLIVSSGWCSPTETIPCHSAANNPRIVLDRFAPEEVVVNLLFDSQMCSLSDLFSLSPFYPNCKK